MRASEAMIPWPDWIRGLGCHTRNAAGLRKRADFRAGNLPELLNSDLFPVTEIASVVSQQIQLKIQVFRRNNPSKFESWRERNSWQNLKVSIVQLKGSPSFSSEALVLSF